MDEEQMLEALAKILREKHCVVTIFFDEAVGAYWADDEYSYDLTEALMKLVGKHAA